MVGITLVIMVIITLRPYMVLATILFMIMITATITLTVILIIITITIIITIAIIARLTIMLFDVVVIVIAIIAIIITNGCLIVIRVEANHPAAARHPARHWPSRCSPASGSRLAVRL